MLWRNEQKREEKLISFWALNICLRPFQQTTQLHIIQFKITSCNQSHVQHWPIDRCPDFVVYYMIAVDYSTRCSCYAFAFYHFQYHNWPTPMHCDMLSATIGLVSCVWPFRPHHNLCASISFLCNRCPERDWQWLHRVNRTIRNVPNNPIWRAIYSQCHRCQYSDKLSISIWFYSLGVASPSYSWNRHYRIWTMN